MTVCSAVLLAKRYDFDQGDNIYCVVLSDGVLDGFETPIYNFNFDSDEKYKESALKFASDTAQALGVPLRDTTQQEEK